MRSRPGTRRRSAGEGMTQEERRAESTPAEQLELSLHAERGQMIVDDLRRLPHSPLTIAEGSPISPEIVSAGIAAPSHAVWLIRLSSSNAPG